MCSGSYGRAEMTTDRMHDLARDAYCIGDEMEKVFNVLLHRAENPATPFGIEQQRELNVCCVEKKRKPNIGGFSKAKG